MKNYYKGIRDFVGLWDLRDTMCSIAMNFKVVYVNLCDLGKTYLGLTWVQHDVF